MIARLGLLFLVPGLIAATSTLLGPEGRAGAEPDDATDAAAKPSTGRAEWNAGPSTRSRDSYLEALRHSRTSTDPREGVVAVDAPNGTASLQRRKEVLPDRDPYSYDRRGAVRNSYGPPQPPRESYGPAFDDYSPYGEYGNAAGVYGPPQQQQGYGSPSPGYGPPYGHGAAHAMTESVHLGLPAIDFSWPFALKLNAFTLAKILLKLVIFKMIVKFIAVICLLLFIPKLEIKKGNKGGSDDSDEDDDGRRALNAEARAWNRLNLLTALVHDALDRHGDVECSTLGCRVRRALEREGSPLDYENLLRGYLLEETRPGRT